DLFEAAVTGRAVPEGADDAGLGKAHRMRRSLTETGLTPRHCVDLLAAFKQDAMKARYADWSELMGYCELSANPVGRYLLDLHGQARSGYPASDALCSALQVLNHLQDIKDDYLDIDRVYLPADWMAAAGVSLEDLAGDAATPGLRKMIDRCLDATDRLLDQADALPLVLDNWRLAMESAAIVRLARRLSAMLRARDPIAERVAFAKPQLVAHALIGAAGITIKRLFTSGRGRGALAAGPGTGK
ncbi:MAG: squalene/phytoene synthase family protein, partial [Alphaproteobacteria bacterium]|nr:squalene/phytoene synthase family protein [Alphaproteobacteria bacterium]